MFSSTESKILDQLALVEKNLLQLENSIATVAARRNPTIEHNIQFARNSIEHAIEKWAGGDLKKAKWMADIAWLRINYARGLYEAELIEAELGEADFLELSPRWQKDVAEILDILAAMIAAAEVKQEGTK